MSLREEQCKKVCRILDDVLANRPTERDSLIVAVRKAFESLEQFENSKPLPSAQPEIIRCKECKHWGKTCGDESWSVGDCDVFDEKLVMCKGFCAWAERRTDETD